MESLSAARVGITSTRVAELMSARNRPAALLSPLGRAAAFEGGQQQMPWPPPGPQPPADLPEMVSRCAVYCGLWVARYGEALEDTIREKHAGQPSYQFLNELHVATPATSYYNKRLRFERSLILSSRERLCAPLDERAHKADAVAAKSDRTLARLQSPTLASRGRMRSPVRDRPETEWPFFTRGPRPTRSAPVRGHRVLRSLRQETRPRRTHEELSARPAERNSTRAWRWGKKGAGSPRASSPRTASPPRTDKGRRALGSPERRQDIELALKQLETMHGRTLAATYSPERRGPPRAGKPERSRPSYVTSGGAGTPALRSPHRGDLRGDLYGARMSSALSGPAWGV